MGKGGDNKTVVTAADASAFLAAVEPSERRADGQVLAALMARLSGEPAIMWGGSIVGFGRYHYRYDSGREGDAPRIAFSPRKAELVLYLSGLDDAGLAPLGRHRRGKGCLYIKRLSDVDMTVLEALILQAIDYMNRTWP